jgi:hypothetical protein
MRKQQFIGALCLSIPEKALGLLEDLLTISHF